MQTVKLVEPVYFPEQYAEVCQQFLRAFSDARRWDMQEGLGIYEIPIFSDTDLLQTFLAEQLGQIAVAATLPDTRQEHIAGEVYECIQTLMERLFAVPGLGSAYTIPESFWSQPLGEMVALAFIWIEGDELVTIAQGAKITGLSVSTLSSRVTRGTLRSYFDPRAKRRQGARLLAMRDLEKIKKGKRQ